MIPNNPTIGFIRIHTTPFYAIPKGAHKLNINPYNRAFDVVK